MKTKADVVIVGGGIIGVATAFYLARARLGNVVVLEREQFLGSGSTSKAAGGVRAQFATRINVEMSMMSEKIFANFKEETDSDAVFEQVGYMFLLSEEKDIEQFKKSHKMQKSLGLKVQMLKPSEIADYAPHVRTDDIKLATFCQDDGLADPSDFLQGFEKAARKSGVEFNLETAITGIKVSAGQVTAVQTNNGKIDTPLVINCAGAWSGEIAKMVGADLKVLPYRRQCVTTGPLESLRPDIPMVVDVASGLYFHKESAGLLLGWADKAVEPSFDISTHPDYTDAIIEKALNRIPVLEEAEIASQWAGLYETTPDHRAIIGWEPTVEGLFHCAGFSGHGMMHAPAAGIVTTEIVQGNKPSIDITDLAPERFANGKTVTETNVI